MKSLKFLTPEQKNYYEKSGFIKLSGVFTEKEINEISDGYNELFERKHKENFQGLESAWTGNSMKNISENIKYTVRIFNNIPHCIF